MTGGFSPPAAEYFRKERKRLQVCHFDLELRRSTCACNRARAVRSAAIQSDAARGPERSVANPKSSRYGAPSGLALNTLFGTTDPCASPRWCAASRTCCSCRSPEQALSRCSHPDLRDSSNGIPWRKCVTTEGQPVVSIHAVTGRTITGDCHFWSRALSRSKPSMNPAGAGVRHRFRRSSRSAAESSRTRNTDAVSLSPSGT